MSLRASDINLRPSQFDELPRKGVAGHSLVDHEREQAGA
jgi:hypothetical protein